MNPGTLAKKAARSKAMVSKIERFRLRNSSGEYLHYSGEGFTVKLPYAWWGTEAQVEHLRKKHAYANLIVEHWNATTPSSNKAS